MNEPVNVWLEMAKMLGKLFPIFFLIVMVPFIIGYLIKKFFIKTPPTTQDANWKDRYKDGV